MNKQSAIIYPFCSEVASLIRHRNLIKNYIIAAVVAPRGYLAAGNDCSLADEGVSIDVKISNDFEDALQVCDTVILAEYIFDDVGFKKSVLDNIEKAIKNGKNIVSILKLDLEDEKRLEKIAKDNGVGFDTYSAKVEKVSHYNEIMETNAPVIAIAGMHESCSKFELQLALREKLLAHGVKVSQIGSKNYCELLGFHSFPQFMFDKGLAEEQKILRLNAYIKDIENKEVPDVILIGIPGGILPINKRLNEYFGITAYEVGCATNIDFTVFALSYMNHVDMDAEGLSQMIRLKLGCEPGCFAMSNSRINAADAMSEYMPLSFDILKYNKIDDVLREYEQGNTPVINGVSEQGKNEISKLVLEYLGVDSINEHREKQVQDESTLQIEDITRWLEDLILSRFGKVVEKGDILKHLSSTDLLYLQAELIQKYNCAISVEGIKTDVLDTIGNLSRYIYSSTVLN